jgi:myo-inositol 2-dehydrogenase/D-chiro-inositol 1-dehydrogenase
MIGQDHIRRLTEVVTGAAVTAVADVDAERAAGEAARAGATALPTGADLVASPDVDAVLVTSWGPTHAEHVLGAIAAGKPVFCEKPLATTPGTVCGSSRPSGRTAAGWCRSASCAASTPATGR